MSHCVTLFNVGQGNHQIYKSSRAALAYSKGSLDCFTKYAYLTQVTIF